MTETLARVRRAGTFVEIRLRLARVIRVLPMVLAIGLTVAAVILAVHKVWPARLDLRHARIAFEILGGAGGLAALVALLYPLAPKTGTMAVDRHYRLHDRLTNALEFEAVPVAERTPFMRAAIDDARAQVSSVRASKVVPIFVVIVAALFSVETLVALLGGAGLAGISLFEIRTLVPAPPKPPPPPRGMAMTKDDIDLLRDASKELERPNQSPEMQAAIERFNQLIQDLADRRLDRAEAFRQLDDIERELNKNIDADQDKLKKELKETSKDLSKSELAQEIADALDKNDLDKARQKTKELADKLRDTKKPLDKAAKEKLAKALKDAAARRKEALDALEKERSKIRERLLQKRHEADAEKDPQKKEEKEKLLKKDERELERLDRENEEQERTSRELSKLDRDLAQAAEDLMKEAGLSAKDLEEAAEDMKHVSDGQMSEKQKEELKQRLEELREMMRQQGQGGKNRASRQKKFAKKARGKNGKGGKSKKGAQNKDGKGGDDSAKDDQSDDGDKGQGDDGDDGDDADNGKPGDGEKPGGKNGGLKLMRGHGPGAIPLPGEGDGDSPGGSQPGSGEGSASGSGDGNGGDKPGGDGSGEGGHSWGTGAGGPVAGKATDPKVGTQDSHVDGQDTGQGASPERAIRVAAEKGFRSKDYQKWFGKYRSRVEESIHKEEVPDSYRVLVRLYFDNIRPADDE